MQKLQWLIESFIGIRSMFRFLSTANKEAGQIEERLREKQNQE